MPVDSYRKDIECMLPRWEAIRDVKEGPFRVKARCREDRRYLPQLPGQKVVTVPDGTGRRIDMYEDYLYRAMLPSWASIFLARVVGILLRKPPKVEVPPTVEPWLANITLKAPAETFEQFARSVAGELTETGSEAICVDWDEKNTRPYVRMFAAGSIRDWREALIPGSAMSVPAHVRVMEPVEEPSKDDEYVRECIPQMRVFQLELNAPLTPEQQNAAASLGPDRYPLGALVIRTYRQVKDDKGVVAKDKWIESAPPAIPTRRGAPLWFIPIVPANPFGLSLEMKKPPLEAAVEFILQYFLVAADYFELLHKVGAGTIFWASGVTMPEEGKTLVVGPGTSHLDPNPESKAEYVQATGESASQLERALTLIIHALTVAIGKLITQQQKDVEQSGTAIELEAGGEEAGMQQIGGTVALLLEQALKIVTWWAGSAETPDDVEDVSVDLADSFIARRLAANELLSLVNALDMGLFTMRDKYHALRQAEALAPETTFEDWIKEVGEDGRTAGGVDLGGMRQSLALLTTALASGDAGKVQAAVQSMQTLIGEGDNPPAANDDPMAGAA